MVAATPAYTFRRIGGRNGWAVFVAGRRRPWKRFRRMRVAEAYAQVLNYVDYRIRDPLPWAYTEAHRTALEVLTRESFRKIYPASDHCVEVTLNADDPSVLDVSISPAPLFQGGRLLLLGADSHKVRGLPLDRLIIDEIADFEDERGAPDLSRECDQCGRNPWKGWESEQCAVNFGSCDGILRNVPRET